MSFSGSGLMATCIAIYPNGSDDWNVDPPFPGQSLGTYDYYVLSNTTQYGVGNTRARPIFKRLTDVGKFSNEVNFLAKTYINKNAEADSDGIGGTAKLKNFNFTVSLSDVESNEGTPTNKLTTKYIQNLYGRRVHVYLTNTGKIEDDDKESVSLLFVGNIYSAKRTSRDVTFTVTGILDTNDPTVKGDIITNSEGQQVMEQLVFGDTSDTYIKLNKIKDQATGSLTLSFTQEDQYEIESLYVKQTNDSNEEFYYPIQTPYVVENGQINFVQDELTTAYLKSWKVFTLKPDYAWARLTVEHYGVVGFALNESPTSFELDPSLLNVGDTVSFGHSGLSPLISNSKMIFLKSQTEVINGSAFTVYFFKAGYEALYGYIAGYVTSNTDPSPLRLYPVGQTLNYYTIVGQTHIIDSPIPIQKEWDATLYGENWNKTNSIELYNQWINWRNGLDHAFTTKNLRQFQDIGENPLIIQINGEQMLVTYTEINTGEPSNETSPNSPIQSYVYVRRSINGITTGLSESNVPIFVLGRGDTRLRYTATDRLSQLRSMSPSEDWKYINLSNWLKGVKDLYVQPRSLSGPDDIDPVAYVCPQWTLPTLSGDLINAYITGNGGVTVDDLNPLDIEYGHRTAAFCAIAREPIGEYTWNTHGSDADHVIRNARFIGKNILSSGAGDPNKYTLFCRTQYQQTVPEGANVREYLSAGEFKYRIKDDMSGLSSIYYSEPNSLIHSVTVIDRNRYRSDVDIGYNSVDDLLKSSMFIYFQNDQREGINASFRCSPLTLNVEMETELKEIEVYAKVIPKNILGEIIDTYTVGDNCTIMQDNGSSKLGYETIIVSDDNVNGFKMIPILVTGHFKDTVKYPGSRIENGYLTKDLQGYVSDGGWLSAPLGHIGFNVKKVYPSDSKYEFRKWMNENDINNDPMNETEITLADVNGITYDEGVTLLDTGDFFVWVDQDNYRMISAAKAQPSSNPVEVIRNLLTQYGGVNIDIDDTTFDIASTQRTNWKCKIIISEETQLKRVVDEIAKEHGLLVFENEMGKMSCVTLDPPAEEDIVISGRNLTDSMILLKSGIADFREEYTDLRYLITELDVYYNRSGENYRGLLKSEFLSYQDALDRAKQFTNNNIKINLKLNTIIDQYTADKIGVLKTYYHFEPTRIVTVNTIFDTVEWQIGEWISSDSIYIKDSELTNSIYLVLKKGVQPVYRDKKAMVELKLYEFNLDDIRLQIHEVPLETVNTNYDEVITDTEQIGEVPDASQ